MGTLYLMHGWAVIFSEVVSVIVASFIPEHFDNLPCGLFAQPMVAYVPGLDPLDTYQHMDKGVSRFVVCFEARGLMRVANCFQCSTYSNCCLGVVEETISFCFCRKTNYIFQNLAFCVDGSIIQGFIVVETVRMQLQIIVSYISAFCSGDNQVPSIVIHWLLHVARKVSEFTIRMMWNKVH